MVIVFADCELDLARFELLDRANHLLPEYDPGWRHFLAEMDAFLHLQHGAVSR